MGRTGSWSHLRYHKHPDILWFDRPGSCFFAARRRAPGFVLRRGPRRDHVLHRRVGQHGAQSRSTCRSRIEVSWRITVSALLTVFTRWSSRQPWTGRFVLQKLWSEVAFRLEVLQRLRDSNSRCRNYGVPNLAANDPANDYPTRAQALLALRVSVEYLCRVLPVLQEVANLMALVRLVSCP